MHKMLFFLTIALVAASCGLSGWDSLLKEYSRVDDVRQILLVKYTGGSDAIAEFYQKDAHGRWELVEKGSAYVGRNGIGKEREGDGRTPEGELRVRRAFGILDNPGCSLEYVKVTQTTFACDEDSPWYNTIIDTAAVHHNCHGEDMSAMVPAYNYGLETDYNDANVYPLGSAIFIHCKSLKYPHTSGCVALDEPFMKKVLTTAGKGLVISVHPAGW